jgi:hypothetical protein
MKEKLERMNFVRLRLQKSKKKDKTYIVINKSHEKKECQNISNNDMGYK